MSAIKHDHYPEIVENGQGTRRLELLGLKEQLREPSDRRVFFAGLSDEQYQQMVGYVNSITQAVPIDYEYQDGVLIGSDTPATEDKAELMAMTYETVRQIVSDPNLDDRTALRRAGLTMAGATSYIHAKDDGNGRMGRAMHYLMEFGTERGDNAFNEEMYAVLARLPVYDTDQCKAINDEVPTELGRALEWQARQSDQEGYDALMPREQASARVVVFLDMMRGNKEVPIVSEVVRSYGSKSRGTRRIEIYQPNEIDGLQLYERDYMNFSEIPNRLPSEVPEGAHRVMAEKVGSPDMYIRIPATVQ